jgi:hypothetical protein
VLNRFILDVFHQQEFIGTDSVSFSGNETSFTKEMNSILFLNFTNTISHNISSLITEEQLKEGKVKLNFKCTIHSVYVFIPFVFDVPIPTSNATLNLYF